MNRYSGGIAGSMIGPTSAMPSHLQYADQKCVDTPPCQPTTTGLLAQLEEAIGRLNMRLDSFEAALMQGDRCKESGVTPRRSGLNGNLQDFLVAIESAHQNISRVAGYFGCEL